MKIDREIYRENGERICKRSGVIEWGEKVRRIIE